MQLNILPTKEPGWPVDREPTAVGQLTITTADTPTEVFEWTVRLVRYVRTEGRLPVIPGPPL